MAKEVSKTHLIERWTNTEPGAVAKVLQYGRQCNYEIFYAGNLKIAAKGIEKDPISGFTKYIMAMVDWQGVTSVYDHILVDANTAIAFPIDQENLGGHEAISSKEV